MKFTDEGLQILKDACHKSITTCGYENHTCSREIFEDEDVAALIDRLEAAERGMFSLETVIRWMRQEKRYERLSAADFVWLQAADSVLEIWRQVAGK